MLPRLHPPYRAARSVLPTPPRSSPEGMLGLAGRFGCRQRLLRQAPAFIGAADGRSRFG